MLGDDADKTRAQLNNIRAKKTKFICLNDDMRAPHPDVQVMREIAWVMGAGVCFLDDGGEELGAEEGRKGVMHE